MLPELLYILEIEEMLPNSLNEASIRLIAKPDKDTTKIISNLPDKCRCKIPYHLQRRFTNISNRHGGNMPLILVLRNQRQANFHEFHTLKPCLKKYYQAWSSHFIPQMQVLLNNCNQEHDPPHKWTHEQNQMIILVDAKEPFWPPPKMILTPFHNKSTRETTNTGTHLNITMVHASS